MSSSLTLEQQLQAARAQIVDLRAQLRHAGVHSTSDYDLRTLLDQARDSVFVSNALNGRFLEVNQAACRNLGYSMDEMLQLSIQDIEAVLPDELQWAAHMQHLRSVGWLALEGVHRRKDGNTFAVEVVTVYLPKPDGVYLLAIARDATQRRETEDKVRTLQSSLLDASRRAGMSEVVSGLLHNVGNVLNSVNVTTEVLLDQLSKSRAAKLQEVLAVLEQHRDDLPGFLAGEQGQALIVYLHKLGDHLLTEHEAQCERARFLRKNVEHMSNIIRLQKSYIPDSGIEETVFLNEFITDAVAFDQPVMNSGGTSAAPEVTLAVECQLLAPVRMDKHRVMQIILNLLSNARAAVQSTDQLDKRIAIEIALTAAGDRLQIQVRDNGIGIPQTLSDKIFQLGFTTKARGHGYGLHMSAVAAEQMGGSLKCHSDGPGLGAAFLLDLPHHPAL